MLFASENVFKGLLFARVFTCGSLVTGFINPQITDSYDNLDPVWSKVRFRFQHIWFYVLTQKARMAVFGCTIRNIYI